MPASLADQNGINQEKSNYYSPLLIVVAVGQEADLILPQLKSIDSIGGRHVYAGVIGGLEVLLIISGMGTVNAASALSAALENRSGLRAVLNLGSAGAYEGCGLQTGQAALATELVHADSGVLSQKKLHGLERIGIPLVHDPEGNAYYNRLPVDSAFSQALSQANPEIAQGRFATVNQVSGDGATAQRIQERWGVILEEMEGAALAQVALHYGVPFAALRGVSNQCGQRELDLKAGARAAQRVFLNWGERL
jgi:futalosine hydrolase